MKKSLLLALLFVATLAAVAQQRSTEEMQAIANAALSKTEGASLAKGTAGATNSIKLYKMSSALTLSATTSEEAFAVYTTQEGPGFVIVSVNEKMPEVLAISYDDNFNSTVSNNPALQNLMENYAHASELISSGKATAAEIFGTTGNILTGTTGTVKGPLLGSIEFDQEYPYNKYCPVINDTTAYTGCVPTCMAQLMKYYRYPTKGTGNISYTTETYKIPISYNFANTTFNWDNICDTYIGEYDPTKPAEIASGRAMYFYTGGDITLIPSTDSYYHLVNKYLYITNIYNNSGSTLNGYLQLIIYSQDGTIVRHASLPQKINNLPAGYGWSYDYLKMNLPGDIEDGEYRLAAGFSTDSVSYKLLTQGYYGSNIQYITVTKSGSTYDILGQTFKAAASISSSNDVAELMMACGAAVKANYKTLTTSASIDNGLIGMNSYFYYDPDTYYLVRDFATTDQIYAAVKEDIDNDHVIAVGGHTSTNDGHAYLIDGYNMTGDSPFFHINWGWNGSCNGYFLITQMQPEVAGAGGAAKNYSYYYYLYLNIAPDNNTFEGNRIRATKIAVTKTSVKVGENIGVTVSGIGNCSLVDVMTDTLRCYMVSDNGRYYKTKQYSTWCKSWPLNPRYSWASMPWDSFTIPNDIPNGTYHIELRYNDNDKFFCADNATITVTGSFDLLIGDVNEDGHVDISDVNAVISIICGNATKETYPAADVNSDGQVDISDVNAVIAIICGSN